MRNLSLEDVDLNAPLISGGLLSAGLVESSRFTRVTFDGCNVRKAVFSDCHFEDCILGAKLMSVLNGVTFKDCRFLNCQADGLAADDCTFENCQWTDVASKGSRWERCRFRGVSATGSFKTVTLQNCSLSDCDFSALEMTDCSLLHNTYTKVRLPDREDNFVVAPATFLRAIDPLRAQLSADGLEIYESLAKPLSTSPSDEIVDDELFEDLAVKDRKTVMQTLYDLRSRDYV